MFWKSTCLHEYLMEVLHQSKCHNMGCSQPWEKATDDTNQLKAERGQNKPSGLSSEQGERRLTDQVGSCLGRTEDGLRGISCWNF